MDIGKFWADFFNDLKKRGLKGVELIISDGHKGIQKAVTTSFQGSSWQMCHVHLIRTVLKTIPKKHQKEVAEKIKETMVDPLQLSEVAKYLKKEGLTRLLKHWIGSISILITTKHFQKSIGER